MVVVKFSLQGWPSGILGEFQKLFGYSDPAEIHKNVILKCDGRTCEILPRILSNCSFGFYNLESFTQSQEFEITWCDFEELKLMVRLLHGFSLEIHEGQVLRMRFVFAKFGIEYFETWLGVPMIPI